MKTGRAPMSYVAHWELTAAAVLWPLAKMTLPAECCDRLVASDASPGGHGIAYTHLPKGIASVWGRWASHRGDYNILDALEMDGLKVPLSGPKRLQKVKLPMLRFLWHEISRPGFYRNIALEEWAAFN